MSAAQLLGPAACLGSAAIWALAANVYSRAARSSSPLAVNFMRASLSFPVFLAIMLFQSGPNGMAGVTASKASWLLVSVLGSYAAGDALFLMSAHRLGVPIALAIASTYPIWSALAGWAFLGQTIGLSGFSGVCLVVAGVIVVVRQGAASRQEETAETNVNRTHSSDRVAGVLLAGGTSLCWALNTFAIAKGGQGLPVAAVNTLRMGIAAALLALISLAMKRRGVGLLVPASQMRRAWPVFLFESVGGTALFVVGLTHSPLAVAAALTSLAPVISVPFAVLIGGERVSARALAGILLVTAGIVLLVGFDRSLAR